MSAPNLLVWLCLLILAAFLLRTSLAFLDHRRIREYIGNRGGVVMDITWASFRSSLLGATDDDLYTVTWEDRTGAVQTARCRTRLFRGVFLEDPGDDPLAMDLPGAGRRLAERARCAPDPDTPGDDGGQA